MRILILGGAGMLGHKLSQLLPPIFQDVYVTFRGAVGTGAPTSIFADLIARDRVIVNVHAETPQLESVLDRVQPDAIINCIGVTYRHSDASSTVHSIAVNSLLPHRLAAWAQKHESRVIHFSTDCVFTGATGGYTEQSWPDSPEFYGRSKALGEIAAKRSLTLRSSMIGRELFRKTELLEWLISNNHGKIRGYTRAIFSGLSTRLWSKVVASLLLDYPELHGLHHVTADPISKFDLLCTLRDAYGLDIDIVPDDTVACDRSLDGTRFASLTKFRAPGWPEIVRDMAEDTTPYEREV